MAMLCSRICLSTRRIEMGRFIDTFSYTEDRPFFILRGSAVLDESESPYSPQFLISKTYRFDLESFEPLTDLLSVYREMYEATPGLKR